MTLRAVVPYLNVNPPLDVCGKKRKCYSTLFFHYFICVRKAPLTKPVSVVLALSPPFLPEQEDHWKAILGKANSITVIFNKP